MNVMNHWLESPSELCTFERITEPVARYRRSGAEMVVGGNEALARTRNLKKLSHGLAVKSSDLGGQAAARHVGAMAQEHQTRAAEW